MASEPIDAETLESLRHEARWGYRFSGVVMRAVLDDHARLTALLAERDAEVARLVAEVGPLRLVAGALDSYQGAVERVKCGSPARDLRAAWAEVKAAADALRAALAARGVES